MVIQTQGRKVEVEIYTDNLCTQKVSSDKSWLHLSSSSNYTDAFNNTDEPLATFIKANTILPTQVKFYLYNDEYIYDENGKLVNPGENDKDGKRSLYIKVTTTTEGEGGEAVQAYHIFRMDQRPAVYAGRFGGEKDAEGNYTMGLVHDRLSARSARYLEDITMGGIQYGYDNVETAAYSYGTDNMDYGKGATRNLAENIKNLTWNNAKIATPQRDASGYILLYQYQYPAASFSARICYDKNRDKNGNGQIDEEEMEWYFPASNQMIGMYLGSILNNDNFPGAATTEDGNNQVKRWYYGVNSYTKANTTSSRCVRDIDISFDIN